jgi:hypothetical protein
MAGEPAVAGKRGALRHVRRRPARCTCRRTCGCCSRRSRRPAPISSWKRRWNLGCNAHPAGADPPHQRRAHAAGPPAAHAIEAAEQCGATYVPEVADLVPLDRLLAAMARGAAAVLVRRNGAWPACDADAGFRPGGHPDRPRGRLFPGEIQRLRGLPYVTAVAWPPHPARRYGRRRRDHAVAGRLRGLAMIREAGPEDRALLEALLLRRIDGAMFPLSNLRTQGVGRGDFPTAISGPRGSGAMEPAWSASTRGGC